MEQTKEIKENTDVPAVTVRLIGIDNRFHLAPIYVAPRFDEIMGVFYVGDKKYKGKMISEQGVDPKIFATTDAPIQLTNVDSFRVAHLDTFDPADQGRMLVLQMAIDSGFVAKDKRSVNPAEHRYYIENKEEEAVQTVSKAKRVRDALSAIDSLSAEKMEDIARLTGEYVKGMSKTQAQAALERLAMDSPDKILSVFDDKDREVKIFLEKLVVADIVKLQNNQYHYNKQLMGVNRDFAIEWLKDKANEAIVRQMAQQLKGIKS